jgi:hypothetical protein
MPAGEQALKLAAHRICVELDCTRRLHCLIGPPSNLYLSGQCGSSLPSHSLTPVLNVSCRVNLTRIEGFGEQEAGKNLPIRWALIPLHGGCCGGANPR